MALGAQPRDILKLVLERGAKLTLAGVGFGIIAAIALMRLMRGLLFGIGPSDPATFLAVATLLTVVAFFAVYLPARRAMRVDPIIALRYV